MSHLLGLGWGQLWLCQEGGNDFRTHANHSRRLAWGADMREGLRMEGSSLSSRHGTERETRMRKCDLERVLRNIRAPSSSKKKGMNGMNCIGPGGAEMGKSDGGLGAPNVPRCL